MSSWFTYDKRDQIAHNVALEEKWDMESREPEVMSTFATREAQRESVETAKIRVLSRIKRRQEDELEFVELALDRFGVHGAPAALQRTIELISAGEVP